MLVGVLQQVEQKHVQDWGVLKSRGPEPVLYQIRLKLGVGGNLIALKRGEKGSVLRITIQSVHFKKGSCTVRLCDFKI